MTREELEKEAEEWLCNNLHSASEEDFIKAMIDIAEPREKRIEELEQKLEQTEKDLDDYQFNYPTIKELQKENAELLEKLKNQKADYETYYKSCYNAQKKAEKQLTKAKEIIHKVCYEYGIYDKDLMEEAKQFLSEVEK